MEIKRIHIYAIYFPTSNKYYVGQAENLERRLPRHIYSKQLVGKALLKYDNWIIEILHTTKDRDIANLLEIEEIRHYNSVCPNGYNLTRGGDGGVQCEEVRNKMSKAKIGNRNALGKKYSKETCIKMSKAQKGTKKPAVSESNKRRKGCKLSEATKRKMQISQLKRRIREFENA